MKNVWKFKNQNQPLITFPMHKYIKYRISILIKILVEYKYKKFKNIHSFPPI